MEMPVETGKEFWRGVLAPGGFTSIPRWSHDPVRGVAEHEAPIPDDHVTALRRLASELAVPLSSVLLAAHAKVLAALSGEREVVTDYVAVPGDRPLPCRLTTEPVSWRSLRPERRRAASGRASDKELPGDGIPAE